MPIDECRDCGEHYQGGKGLKGGRCPTCFQALVDRRTAAGLLVGPEDQAE